MEMLYERVIKKGRWLEEQEKLSDLAVLFATNTGTEEWYELIFLVPANTSKSCLDSIAQFLSEHVYKLMDISTEERNWYAIDLAVRYGGIDDTHHKDWVIDQMVRVMAGDHYNKIVAQACDGEDGSNTFTWECGIAP